MTNAQLQAQRDACDVLLWTAAPAKAVAAWWDTANQRLGGSTPMDALRDGYFREVWKVVLGLLDSNFL